MSTPAGGGSGGGSGGVEGIDVGDLQQMVDRARAVLDAVAALPELASGERAVRWAQVQRSEAGDSWARLSRHLREGNAAAFNLDIRSTVSFAVPMADAPPELEAPAQGVVALTQPLGTDFQRVFLALMGDDGYRPGVEDWLHETLPRLATGA